KVPLAGDRCRTLGDARSAVPCGWPGAYFGMRTRMGSRGFVVVPSERVLPRLDHLLGHRAAQVLRVQRLRLREALGAHQHGHALIALGEGVDGLLAVDVDA